MDQEKLKKIQNKVQKYLDEYRFRHTIGVMYTAGSLAMCHGADLEKAMIAGLLHDCAKCIPGSKKISLCEKHQIPISEIEYANPGLLHAKLGAYFAGKKYHIEDAEILSAIACHTTGKPDMTILEKIIYIADYIEPGRAELPNMKVVRELAYRDLNACMYRILKDSLEYLNSRHIPLDPMTENAYYYYDQWNHSIQETNRTEQEDFIE